MPHPSEETILRCIGGKSKTELTHIYLYRMYRNVFYEEDGYTSGYLSKQTYDAQLMNKQKQRPIHFIARGNHDRLTDICRVSSHEATVYTSGGTSNLWLSKPDSALAKTIMQSEYARKRDILLEKVARYDRVIDSLK